jgi:N-acetylmuramate 1-kinase
MAALFFSREIRQKGSMQPVLEKFLADEAATLKWGAEISKFLRPGDIVKFIGPLGAGKTTLVRGLVTGLGGNPDQVHSPTFSLVHEYQTSELEIFHCDFYRLPAGSTLDEFGGLEFFAGDPIFFIEWPERVSLFESAIPNRLLGVDLQEEGEGRKVRLFGPWEIDE